MSVKIQCKSNKRLSKKEMKTCKLTQGYLSNSHWNSQLTMSKSLNKPPRHS